jgi:hypothetical protein
MRAERQSRAILPDKITAVRRLAAEGKNKSAICRETSLHHSTVERVLRDTEIAPAVTNRVSAAFKAAETRRARATDAVPPAPVPLPGARPVTPSVVVADASPPAAGEGPSRPYLRKLFEGVLDGTVAWCDLGKQVEAHFVILDLLSSQIQTCAATRAKMIGVRPDGDVG